MRKFALSLIVLTILQACSSAPVSTSAAPLATEVTSAPAEKSPASEKAESKKLLLALSGARRLTLEPCGCSAASMGGIPREANLLEAWRSKTAKVPFMLIGGGTTFIPPKEEPVTLDKRPAKANKLVNALREIGMVALSPSVEDLSLGTEWLQALEKQAGFPFVMTNVRTAGKEGKPLFATSFTKEVAGDRVTILGVTWPLKGKAKLPKGLVLENPVTSVERALKTIPNPGVVVLVSSAPVPKLREVVERNPSIRFVLDAREGDAAYFELYGARSFLVWPRDRGREIALFDVDIDSQRSHILWESMQSTQSEKLLRLEGEKSRLEERLTLAKLPVKETKRLRATLKRYDTQLARVRQEVVAEPEKAMKFEFSLEPVNSSYDLPKNKLTEIVRAE